MITLPGMFVSTKIFVYWCCLGLLQTKQTFSEDFVEKKCPNFPLFDFRSYLISERVNALVVEVSTL